MCILTQAVLASKTWFFSRVKVESDEMDFGEVLIAVDHVDMHELVGKALLDLM